MKAWLTWREAAERPKACLTCRVRKIEVRFAEIQRDPSATASEGESVTDSTQCDLSRPECSNCTRDGHVCRGYERPRVFVNHAASTAATATAAANPNPVQKTLAP